ncbi:MAG TPA: lysophospholipid acyltransferase family protein [Pyrinomonadaceae bacterium]
MKSKSTLRTNVEYWAARLILAVFSMLPLRFSLRLGSCLSRLFYSFAEKLRRTGRRNLALAFPELSPPEQARLLSGCFENLGRLLGAFSHFEKESLETWREIIDIEGLEQLETARAQGRGIILFTGHVGAWELTSFALSLFDQPLSFLVRRIDNPRIEALVDAARTCRGNRTIDKMFAAREMLETLRRGGTLGILVDLNTLDREAVFVDFFGIKAATTFIVAKLALRTGASIVPVFAPWDEKRRKFTLKIDEPLSFAPTGDEEADAVRLTQLITNVVESYVRRYPDQWLWIHRRWKTRPPGEPGIY